MPLTREKLLHQRNLPVGQVDLTIGTASFTFTVSAEKELYDIVLSYKDDTLQAITPVVRYPIGGNVIELTPGQSLATEVTQDGSIVMLQEGAYPADAMFNPEGVLVFGAWSASLGPLSVFDGDIDVRGGNNRMRGVHIDGTITSSANQFSAAFCKFTDANITGNTVSLIRNEFTTGSATVPSSNAILVDNENLD